MKPEFSISPDAGKEDLVLLMVELARFALYKSLSPETAREDLERHRRILDWWTSLPEQQQTALESLAKECSNI